MLSVEFIDFAHTLSINSSEDAGKSPVGACPQDLQLHSSFSPPLDTQRYSPLQAQGVSSNSAPWPFPFPSLPAPTPLPPALAHLLRTVEEWRPQVPSPQGPRTLPQPAGGQGGWRVSLGTRGGRSQHAPGGASAGGRAG